MNSVIAGSSFVTSGEVNSLAKGAIALRRSDGKLVTAAADVTKGHMYQFVVGLGNGNVKEGVWLNPIRSTLHKVAYKAPAAKTITFSDVAITIGDAYVGCEIAIVITTIPKNSFMADKSLVSTAIISLAPGETEVQAKARIKTELDKLISRLNNIYGDGSLTATPADGTTIDDSLVITGKAGFWFEVGLEGLISGTKTDNGVDIIGNGTSAFVAALEKNEDVSKVGYNPNFIQAYTPYGDIFTTDMSKTYNTYVIHSRSERNHVFDINTLGMEVVQYIAFDSTGTAATLEAVLAAFDSTGTATTSKAVLAASDSLAEPVVSGD